ncbi:hypothetical protein PbJCM13498_09580 [Prolixibacter bellariivorans]|uniref:Uncharacterized protein n=1 Tax=Prolixibacter bellariivorans TaxID=314319 RepID=A0A5M4AVY8_9BACT|nr:hypothetical protein PbJCM13498_09580 [Prolixibacter bellariivorans]
MILSLCLIHTIKIFKKIEVDTTHVILSGFWNHYKQKRAPNTGALLVENISALVSEYLNYSWYTFASCGLSDSGLSFLAGSE